MMNQDLSELDEESLGKVFDNSITQNVYLDLMSRSSIAFQVSIPTVVRVVANKLIATSESLVRFESAMDAKPSGPPFNLPAVPMRALFSTDMLSIYSNLKNSVQSVSKGID